MQFPELSMPWIAVAGACAVVIPIIIHLLLKPPTRPMPWAAMAFVMEAARRSMRGMRIRRILLLIVRCLIPLTAGLMLAGPLMGSLTTTRHVELIIDNSAVSGIPDEAGRTGLDRVIAHAQDVVSSLDPSDTVAVTTLDHGVERVVHTSPASAHQALDDVGPTSLPAQLDVQIDRVLEHLENHETHHAEIILLSEFRRASHPSIGSPLNIPETVTLRYATPSRTELTGAIQIVDARPLRRIRYLGDEAAVIPQLRVTLGRVGRDAPAIDSVLHITAYTTSRKHTVAWLDGQHEQTIEIALDPLVTSGQTWTEVTLHIDDQSAAVQKRHVVIEHPGALRVLVLAGEDAPDTIDEFDPVGWVVAILESGGLVPRVLQGRYVEATDLMETDAVIVTHPEVLDAAAWNLLARTRDVKMLLVMPGGQGDSLAWVQGLSDAIGVELPLLGDVRLVSDEAVHRGDDPGLLSLISSELDTLAGGVDVNRVVPLGIPDDWTAPLTTESGVPLVLHGRSEHGGMILVMTTSLRSDWSDLLTRPVVVPLLHESLRAGLGIGRPGASVTTGARVDHALHITEDRTSESGLIDAPGVWRVPSTQGAPELLVQANVDPDSLDTSIMDPTHVAQGLGGRWQVLDLSEGPVAANPLAGMMIMAWVLLGLLLIETILARSLSHRTDESVRRPGVVT